MNFLSVAVPIRNRLKGSQKLLRNFTTFNWTVQNQPLFNIHLRLNPTMSSTASALEIPSPFFCIRIFHSGALIPGESTSGRNERQQLETYARFPDERLVDTPDRARGLHRREMLVSTHTRRYSEEWR